MIASRVAGEKPIQRTVSLAKPIGCERRLYDGAVGRPPQFAGDAGKASVTFSCPASA
jgi:hypothetical protein